MLLVGTRHLIDARGFVTPSELHRLWHTVRYLKPVQIYGRARFRLLRPRPDLSPAPDSRSMIGPWKKPAARRRSLTGLRDFHFLGQTGALDEIGWDGPERSKLWRYNQHYFDDLNAERSSARVDWHLALIKDWVAQNPPGQGTGWEPYPTSLRIVNWVKWALAGNQLPSEAVHSLAVQARWLSRRLEWHLLGNHLFANAKALVFVGSLFAGAEADSWRTLGSTILAREFSEQILPDGGHFELSTMYHALAVEDLLDLVNLAGARGESDAQAEAAVPAMLNWLRAMCHPDGEIAFFNDAAFAVAPSPAEIFSYAKRLGLLPPAEPDALTWLSDSGYTRLAVGPAVLIADLARVGPNHLPGHAHADTLSFELSLQGQRVIVNSGTSVYGTAIERQRQRGTAAHSTLMIDGKDSSEVWSGFRVGRRAYPFDISVREEGGALVAKAAHNGYRHLPGAPIHRREWLLCRSGLDVIDTVEGAGRHEIDLRFHLAPALSAQFSANDTIEVMGEHAKPVLALSVEGGSVEIEPSSWHPQFGTTVQSQAIHIRAIADMPFRFHTRFWWGAA